MQKIPKQDINKILIPAGIGALVIAVVTIISQNVGVGIIIGVIMFAYLDSNQKHKELVMKIDYLNRKEVEEDVSHKP